MKTITKELVREVNDTLLDNHLKQLILDLPHLHLQILLIAYYLYKNEKKINSKTIWEDYQKNPNLPKRDFSRISQIITSLEKDGIVYVSQSKKTKLRELSIEENIKEIEQVLIERGEL